MIAFLLGRQPEIGRAELSAVFGNRPEMIAPQIAVLPVSLDMALEQAPFLGSIIKMIDIKDQNFIINKTNLNKLAEQLFSRVDGKITLGVSIYDKRATTRTARNITGELSQAIKNSGNSLRTITSKDTTLSTATVLHNGLSGKNPKKIELNFIKSAIFGQDRPTYRTLVGTTIFVQDLNAYTFRDRSRPYRDARNGMLPPKLAQTMINLAIGAANPELTNSTLLDPFCGTGVILQEATLRQLNVMGSDLNPEMIKYTKGNLDWLASTHNLTVSAQLLVGDATEMNWGKQNTNQPIGLIASEAYLGKPYTSPPSSHELQTNITTCNIIIDKTLKNLSGQLPIGAGICLGVPVWFIGDKTKHLPLIGDFSKYGFNNKTIGKNLIYHRPEQIVGRELLVLQKI